MVTKHRSFRTRALAVIVPQEIVNETVNVGKCGRKPGYPEEFGFGTGYDLRANTASRHLRPVLVWVSPMRSSDSPT